MAVIPLGTANDFATSIGLPEDPWEALQLCTMDTAQPIDVGLVNDKVRPFLSDNIAFTTSTTPWFPDQPREHDGHTQSRGA